MAKISDLIENFLKDLIKETEGVVEIQRNELASYFNCVPSQINYVIDTRFTAENGYIVESRRGGGGYIKIKKINITKGSYLVHILNSMGDSITQQNADMYIVSMYEYGVITEREAQIMRVVTNDRVLSVPQPLRDQLRANLLRHMILKLV